MRHLIVCREFPPAAYAPGGIGTYVSNMARALVTAGETVHVVGQQWRGAPLPREEQCDGRLIVHRVPMDRPIDRQGATSHLRDIRLLSASNFRAQAWSWNASLLAESLVEHDAIDVIEAQEWEAPLHFFLLRRALGLGPSRTPPVIVHLHSPSELIWEHNGWPAAHPALLAVRRSEEYCIAAADALLCPSRFLATQLAARYALDERAIEVIPYPLRDRWAGRVELAPASEQSSRASGPVVYVGRLEGRKGVLEFTDAAIEIAREDQDVEFHFIGADVRGPHGASTLAALRRRIPGELAGRLRFRGVLSREEIAPLLAAARFAVIPSRWENFPNTCIEAMEAGVPLLVSPSGGMSEVVVDGVNGWVASSAAAHDLADALRRALAATAAERSRMGAAAAAAIRRHCGTDEVVRRQRTFREAVVARGSGRSLRLPPSLPWAGAKHAPGPNDGATPIGALDPGTQAPGTREVVPAVPNGGRIAEGAFVAAGRHPAGHIVVAAPGYIANAAGVALAASVLERFDDVGVVTGWIERRGTSRVAPTPAFPYQWVTNDCWPIAVVRAAALLRAGPPCAALAEPYASWDQVTAILALGYRGVSIPARLARAAGGRTSDVLDPFGRVPPDEVSLARMRERFAARRAYDAEALASLESASDASCGWTGESVDRWTGLSLDEIVRLPFGDKLALAAELLHHPSRLVGWARARMRGAPGAGE